MADFDSYADLAGTYTGTSYLWLDPSTPVAESVSMAELSTTAHGGGLVLDYDWDEHGPQDGLMLIGRDPDSGEIIAAWTDSWHTAGRLMRSRGTLGDDDTVDVLGSYGAVPGPAWGWRTVISPNPSTGFTLTMYNITPEGEEMKAVEVDYQRVNPID